MSLALQLLFVAHSSATAGLVEAEPSRFTALALQDGVEVADAEEPAPPQWLGFGWTGGMTAGLTVQRGNTRSHTSSVSFSAEGRGEDDRVSVGASYISGRTEDTDPTSSTFRRTQTTARLLTGQAKFDRFLNEEQTYYGYLKLLGVSDGVRDLDLLWNVTVGLGYQWLEEEKRDFLGLGEKTQNFFTEVGVGYTDEDYADNTADTDYVSGRVAMHYDVALSDTALFFHDSEWIPSLEDFEDDQLVRTKTGLRTNISGNLNAEFSVLFDWDSSPATGFGRRDVTYIFGLNWGF